MRFPPATRLSNLRTVGMAAEDGPWLSDRAVLLGSLWAWFMAAVLANLLLMSSPVFGDLREWKQRANQSGATRRAHSYQATRFG